MPISISLKLPNNLTNTLHNSDFIQQLDDGLVAGHDYFTGRYSLLSHKNKNSSDTDAQPLRASTLIFGFDAYYRDIDRLPLCIDYIEELIISASSEFPSDRSIHFFDFPKHNPNKLHRIVVHKSDFSAGGIIPYVTYVDLNNNQQDLRGLYEFVNYPFSGEGGIAKVYIRAKIKTLPVEYHLISQYPEINGISTISQWYPDTEMYDTIVWISNPPPRQSIVVPDHTYIVNNSGITTEWTGRKTIWKFNASEQSGINTTTHNISRYVSDIIEIRPNVFNNSYINISKQYLDDSRYTTLLPRLHCLGSDEEIYYLNNTECRCYYSSVHNFDNSITSIGISSIPYGITTSGIMINQPIVGFTTTTDIAPDFVFQSYFEPTLSCSNDICCVDIRCFNGIGSTGIILNSIDNITENLGVYVLFGEGVTPVATTYFSGVSTTRTIGLPNDITSAILGGGTIELYISPKPKDNVMYLQSYFTPKSYNDIDSVYYGKSYLLSSEIVPIFKNFFGSAYLGGAIIAYTNNGISTSYIEIKELASGIGRFLLNADVGDCKNDDNVENGFSIIASPRTSWDKEIGLLGSWILQSDLAPSTYVYNYDNTITLNAPKTSGVNSSRHSVVEIHSTKPSFSSRTKVNVTLSADSISGNFGGELYVAFSPIPSLQSNNTEYITGVGFTYKTMGSRCEPYIDIPESVPTVMVLYSKTKGKTSVIQRCIDGKLIYEDINDVDNISGLQVELNGMIADPESKFLNNIILTVNDINSGITTIPLSVYFPANDIGMGYYVAVGSRADILSDFDDPGTAQDGFWKISTIRVDGLQREDANLFMPQNERFYGKYTSGNINNKNILGQHLISSKTDIADYGMVGTGESTTNYAFIVPVNHISNFEDCLHPDIFEIKMISTSAETAINSPRMRFYGINSENGYPGKPLLFPCGNWVSTSNVPPEIIQNTGCLLPYNDLIQFDISKNGVGNTDFVWAVVEVPNKCKMANSFTDLMYTDSTGIGIQFLSNYLYNSTFEKFGIDGWNAKDGVFIGIGTTIAISGDYSMDMVFGGVGAEQWDYDTGSGTGVSSVFIIDYFDNNQYVDYQYKYGCGENCLQDFVDVDIRDPSNNSVEIYDKTNDTDNCMASGRFVPAIPDMISTSCGFNNIDSVSSGFSVAEWDNPLNARLVDGVFANASIYNSNVRAITDFLVCTGLSTTISSIYTLCEIQVNVNGYYNCARRPDNDPTWIVNLITDGSTVQYNDCNSVRDVIPYGISKNVIFKFGKDIIDNLNITNAIINSPNFGVQVCALQRPNNNGEDYNIDFYIDCVNVVVKYIDLSQQLYTINFVLTDEGKSALSNPSDYFNFVVDDVYVGNKIRIVNNAWYKMFSGYIHRHDNVLHRAFLQSRVMSDSHAPADINDYINFGVYHRYYSQPTPLSRDIRVDITPPTKDGTGRSFLYVLPPYNGIGVTAVIEASDDDSGIYAFRFAKESRQNKLYFEPWKSWDSYVINPGIATYRLVFPIREKGGFYQAIGPRKAWVQTIDRAGNISESNIVGVTQPAIAIIDTKPPHGKVHFIDLSTGEITNRTNKQKIIFGFDAYDEATDVKDYQWRDVGFTTWSEWKDLDSYQQYYMGTSSATKRVEVRFRDYANNVSDSLRRHDILPNKSIKNVLFNESAEYNGELYMSGIWSKEYSNLILKQSQDTRYRPNTAYTIHSSDTDQTIYVNQSDSVLLKVKGIYDDNFRVFIQHQPDDTLNPLFELSENEFYIENGYIIFAEPRSDDDEFVVLKVRKDVAVIYKWNGNDILKIGDMTYQNEKMITSMLVVNDVLMFATNSGKIYQFDGWSIGDPIAQIKTTEELPITKMFSFQFDDESESYIYVTTAKQPTLWRIPYSGINSNNKWECISSVSNFITSTASYITKISDIAGAYNQLFMITDSNFVFKYTRGIDSEYISYEQLMPSMFNDEEVQLPMPSAITLVDKHVVIGLGNKPELYSYYCTNKPNPEYEGEYNVIKFDYQFVKSPHPWQYYNSNGQTNIFSSNNIFYETVDTNGLQKYYMHIVGNEKENVSLTLDNASDLFGNIGDQWTMDLYVKYIGDGNNKTLDGGRQSLQVWDGRYNFDLTYSTSSLRLQSGDNIIETNLGGSIKTWDFHTSGGYTPDTQRWVIDQDISSMSVSVNNRLVCNINGTNPRIKWLALNQNETFDIKQNTKIQILIGGVSDPNAELRVYVSTDYTTNWESHAYSHAFIPSQEMLMYTIDPSITGNIKAIAIEVSGVKSKTGLLSIDYITFVNTANINNNILFEMVPMRICVNDRNIKIYMGRSNNPIISADGFLKLSTAEKKIKIGKLHNYKYELDTIYYNNKSLYEPSSEWAYEKLAFKNGVNDLPVVVEEHNFAPFYRFSSGRGVSKFFNYLGADWVAIAGKYITNKNGDSNYNVLSDMSMKFYSYDESAEIWQYRPVYIGDDKLVISPTMASGYKSSLIINGRYLDD